MKIILSRKGFESEHGGLPSPILPDGTLLSLPIPSKTDETKFADLYYGDVNYYEIIQSLKPNTKIKESYTCHLDPDIRRSVINRPNGWQPAFGQEGASLRHLQKQGVGVGDLFLFFGWFRQTELIDGKLSYVKGAPDLHIIYGYLQVGSIIESPNDAPQWLNQHPHIKTDRWEQPNAIYIASPSLTLCPELPGAGCLQYSDRLILTKQGCSRRVWALPDFFRNIPITYNANSWQEDCFVSAAKGQEFVFDANDEVIGWIKQLIDIPIAENTPISGLDKIILTCKNLYSNVFNVTKHKDKKDMNKISMEKKEIVGVYHDEEDGSYFFEVIPESEEEQFKILESSNLEALFVISPKEFDSTEKPNWQLPCSNALYVDRIRIALDIVDDVIYDVIYDFMVISADERKATTLRVKVERNSPLEQNLAKGEDYVRIKDEQKFSFFEVDVKNFS